MRTKENRFLLLGPQSIGKTLYADRLAKALGVAKIIDIHLYTEFPSNTLAIGNDWLHRVSHQEILDVVVFEVFSEQGLIALIKTLERADAVNQNQHSKENEPDGGCGHGLVRAPYEKHFRPCQCGQNQHGKVPPTIVPIEWFASFPEGPNVCSELRARWLREFQELHRLDTQSSRLSGQLVEKWFDEDEELRAINAQSGLHPSFSNEFQPQRLQAQKWLASIPTKKPSPLPWLRLALAVDERAASPRLAASKRLKLQALMLRLELQEFAQSVLSFFRRS